MKVIIKVIKSLENRRVLLKRTTKINAPQEGGFFRPLMTTGLSLLKSTFTPLSKSALLPLRLSAGMSAADAAIQKKIYG